MSVLAVAVDVEASLLTLTRNEHVLPDGMLKLSADLDRYAQIIEATRPEVVVETGTYTGASAQWFAEHGVDVITVDIDGCAGGGALVQGGVIGIVGSSTDPDVVDQVRRLVHGRRCMVSLDSDHSGAHVAKEIEMYGPMVTAGCYLVVEDGIFGHAPQQIRDMHFPARLLGSPLDAIALQLHGNPDWSRDIAIERMSPTSHHPAGWWVRNG